MEVLTEKEIERVTADISRQEGRKYPCSNQIVTCGFFSDDGKWQDFVNENKYKLKYNRKDSICLADDEIWHHFSMTNYSCRGYRFYKIKVDRNINRWIFYENIYPYCSMYCKEIEWI